MTDSTSNTPLEIKPPLLPSMHSDASDPPLTIDEGSSDGHFFCVLNLLKLMDNL